MKFFKQLFENFMALSYSRSLYILGTHLPYIHFSFIYHQLSINVSPYFHTKISTAPYNEYSLSS